MCAGSMIPTGGDGLCKPGYPSTNTRRLTRPLYCVIVVRRIRSRRRPVVTSPLVETRVIADYHRVAVSPSLLVAPAAPAALAAAAVPAALVAEAVPESLMAAAAPAVSFYPQPVLMVTSVLPEEWRGLNVRLPMLTVLSLTTTDSGGLCICLSTSLFVRVSVRGEFFLWTWDGSGQSVARLLSAYFCW